MSVREIQRLLEEILRELEDAQEAAERGDDNTEWEYKQKIEYWEEW